MTVIKPLNAVPSFGQHRQKKPDLSSSLFTINLPWISGPHQVQDTYTCLASRLPLKHYWDIPRFLYWTLRIYQQLHSAEGLVGYRLKADLGKKTFWTLSAWNSNEQMERFVRSGNHKKMLAAMKGRLGMPLFSNDWQVPKEQTPLTWEQAKRQLEKNI